MPRGDGTGPQGLGSMTGRAAGYCAGSGTPGNANAALGRGFGAGFGRGPGFSRKWISLRGFGISLQIFRYRFTGLEQIQGLFQTWSGN